MGSEPSEHPSNAPMGVTCPTCGAGPGERCEQRNGKPAGYPHAPRRRVANGEALPAHTPGPRDRVLDEVERAIEDVAGQPVEAGLSADYIIGIRTGLRRALNIVSKLRNSRG